jgi:3-hydroxyisobutyrate dehydrogenase-like beta-hydroxyacid dehydrogenase
VTVGFAGLGRMGLPMARNILRTSFPLIVYNRTSDRTATLVAEGARAVDAPAGLGVCDIVVTMVSDAAAARALLVESGLLDALASGSVVVEMSTIGPRAAEELAHEAGQRDVALLDAPVSGSVSLAESAQLSAMVGGSAEAYERATPVLDAMTKRHVHLGRSGAGAAMKLAVNSLIAATNEAIAEALVLAERCGIDPEDAYDVLAGSAVASPFVLYKRNAFLHPDAEPVAFTAALMRKDLALVEELAERLHLRMPVSRAAADVLEEALGRGLADADMASVLGLLDVESTVTSGAGSHDLREES